MRKRDENRVRAVTNALLGEHAIGERWGTKGRDSGWQIFFNRKEWPEVEAFLVVSDLHPGEGDYHLHDGSDYSHSAYRWVHERGFDSVIQIDTGHKSVRRIKRLFGMRTVKRGVWTT